MPVHEGYLYAAPGGNGVPYWHTAWGDALGNVALATKVGTATEAYRDTTCECDFLQHILDGELNGTLQFDHDWELDTQIDLHLHLLPMANGAGDAYFTHGSGMDPDGPLRGRRWEIASPPFFQAGGRAATG